MRVLFMLTLFLACPSLLLAQDDHWEAGGGVTYIFLRQIGSSDSRVGTEAVGFGARTAYRLSRYLDLDAELVFHPNAGVSGYRLQGLFGAKAGFRGRKAGIFAKARPGFIYFSKDPFGASAPNGMNPLSPTRASSTDRSMDLGGVFEYYTERGLTLRFDLGDTIINYEARSVSISQFQPPLRAGGFTTDNWQGTFGIGFRF